MSKWLLFIGGIQFGNRERRQEHLHNHETPTYERTQGTLEKLQTIKPRLSGVQSIPHVNEFILPTL